MKERVSGKVKWFDSDKGYGYIVSGSGEEVFVHYTAIKGDGFRDLKEGEQVEFDVVESRRGKQAVNVEKK